MKRFLLIFIVQVAVLVGSANAQKGGEEKDIRSDLPGRGTNTFDYSKYPEPFDPYSNLSDQPAVSTGYYFNDNLAVWNGIETKEYLPKFNSFENPSTFDPERWTEVVSGPRIVPKSTWENNPKGQYFFRNPAYPIENGGDYFEYSASFGTDSTDDAIAGPIPLGLKDAFLFNGIRYDSFYVSTNGVIALTNRRYHYDESGERIIPAEKEDAYDIHSMDWFANNELGRKRLPGITSITDAITDDFGYTYSVLGGKTGLGSENSRGGIRSYPTNGNNINSVIDEKYKSALIAPFWADMQVSQWDVDRDSLDPKGKVYFKTDSAQTYLTIYLKKFQFLSKDDNSIWTPTGSFTINENQRLRDGAVPEGSAQVFLDSRDTSITVVYGEFAGSIYIGGRIWGAADIFRWNTLAGVRGFARHANYGRPGGPQVSTDEQPWVSEYPQYTEYWRFQREHHGRKVDVNGRYVRYYDNYNYPVNLRSVRYKQIPNKLRIEAIEFKVRSLNPLDDLDFTERVSSGHTDNYELYDGHVRLESLQPIAYIQNISNNIQGTDGINYQEQDIEFEINARVVNYATGKISYNYTQEVSDQCLAGNCDSGSEDGEVALVGISLVDGKIEVTEIDYDRDAVNNYHDKKYNGIPPMGYTYVAFPPYTPDFESDIGRQRLEIRAGVLANSEAEIEEGWIFDNIASTEINVLNQLSELIETFDEFEVVNDVPQPISSRWINEGAAIVSGSSEYILVSDYPLGTPWKVETSNSEAYPDFYISQPTLEMNRIDLKANDWDKGDGNAGGDILTSHPINIRDKKKAVLSLSIQRTRSRRDQWGRGYDGGYSDLALIGPEPRVIFNGNILDPYTSAVAASARPDSIVIEFAKLSVDGISGIANIAEKDWRYLPRRGKLPTDWDAIEREVPSLAVFGGGGYLSPFYESDIDSILHAPNSEEIGALRANIYDTGIDFGFKKYFVPIPDTFTKGAGAENFRFRIRVAATNDQKCVSCIPDDSDNFYVDNISLLDQEEGNVDLEMNKVSIRWPYESAPRTQASEIPVQVTVSNNSMTDSPFYYTQVVIFKHSLQELTAWHDNVLDILLFNDPVYCRRVTIPSHTGMTEQVWDFPTFDGAGSGEGLYTMIALCEIPGSLHHKYNNIAMTEFELKFGRDFGYDKLSDPYGENHVPVLEGAKPGQGLSLHGYQTGGQGNANGYVKGFSAIPMSVGDIGGSGSGTIAMKFDLISADTFYGYRAYFGEVNSAPDDISYALYSDNNGIPGDTIPLSVIRTERAYDSERTPASNYQDYFFAEYVICKLKDSIILPKGTYWIGLTQLGETSVELGASSYKGGQRTMNISVELPIGEMGLEGHSNNINPEFREKDNYGNLVNKNVFAFRNSNLGKHSNWRQFTPEVGNPSYPHLDHTGRSPGDNYTQTLTRGFWIPLLRPVFRDKGEPSDQPIEECENDSWPVWLPVELTTFEARATGTGIDLYWETTSEVDNYGFYIERRDITPGVEDEWTQIEFVKGNGTTTVTSEYSFTDKTVANGRIYSYKLRQVDRDGSQSCYETLVQTVMFDGDSQMVLKPASPNPFGLNSSTTSIKYTVSVGGYVRLDIVDIFGNKVKTLVSEEKSSGSYSATWDATDASGREMPTGNYVYRLTTNDGTLTNKVQFRK